MSKIAFPLLQMEGWNFDPVFAINLLDCLRPLFPLEIVDTDLRLNFLLVPEFLFISAIG